MQKHLIQGIILTLDDVLYNYTSTLGILAIDRAVQQLIEENAFRSAHRAREALRNFRNSFGYRKGFPRFVADLVSQEKLSPAGGRRVIVAYKSGVKNKNQNIQLFKQSIATLQKLKTMGYKLALMCSGTAEVEWSKIKALGLDNNYFDYVSIITIGTAGDAAKSVPVLKEISKKLNLKPSKVALLGKRVFAELKAAKQIGILSIRMMCGKYSSIMPADELEKPDFQISSIEELLPVLKLAEQKVIRPNIVLLGGGTGLAVLLHELRDYPAELTAIVTVFDSGRHSGKLRKTLGILPPGDIRNCLVALSDSDQLMNQLMNYRFKDSYMEGCSLGNLLLAALTDIQNGFENAITSISNILNIHGTVLPATLDDTELCAELVDGTNVVSEVNVRSSEVQIDGKAIPKPAIKRVYLEKSNVQAFQPAIEAIENADIIVISPGGFYTSIIATVLVPGIRDAIIKSAGAKVYISNVATQRGQTDGYTLPQTLQILSQYLGPDTIDYIIANNTIPPFYAAPNTSAPPPSKPNSSSENCNANDSHISSDVLRVNTNRNGKSSPVKYSTQTNGNHTSQVVVSGANGLHKETINKEIPVSNINTADFELGNSISIVDSCTLELTTEISAIQDLSNFASATRDGTTSPYFQEQLLLPTEDMVQAERPILVQGRCFEDASIDKVEWDKVPMIKHSGEMVVAMLYRIIEKEMSGEIQTRVKSIFYKTNLDMLYCSEVPNQSSIRRKVSNRQIVSTNQKSTQSKNSGRGESVMKNTSLICAAAAFICGVIVSTVVQKVVFKRN